MTKTLEDSDTISLILVAPPYLFMVVWSAAHSLASDRLGQRFWFYMYPGKVSGVKNVEKVQTADSRIPSTIDD